MAQLISYQLSVISYQGLASREKQSISWELIVLLKLANLSNINYP
ncbi:hypothetical protein C789_4062 [Microcystis aeruginosa FACHB-905 = DIANCHI905]|nr:hypothetical protein C789_4062 [Microcystis aeruginosa FACHB-905 = DIANCHI905]